MQIRQLSNDINTSYGPTTQHFSAWMAVPSLLSLGSLHLLGSGLGIDSLRLVVLRLPHQGDLHVSVGLHLPPVLLFQCISAHRLHFLGVILSHNGAHVTDLPLAPTPSCQLLSSVSWST